MLVDNNSRENKTKQRKLEKRVFDRKNLEVHCKTNEEEKKRRKVD